MPTSPVIDLSEKVALVTGAGSGIGRASAIRYAQAGACVMCADIDADGAKVTAERIRGEGGEAASLQLDVTDESAVEKSLQQTIDALGGFDILFNNAGVGDIDYQKTLDVNQNGVYYGLKHGSAVLAERGGGAIVNISSSIGQMTGKGFTAYGTAKGAMSHFTKLLAEDLAPKIRVNAIAVGSTATSALETVLTNDAVHNAMVEATPLKRLGEPEDMALGALYLASPASAFVTGSVMEIHGGITSANLDLGIAGL